VHEVDILLVKPFSQKQLYGKLSTSRLTAVEPPLWAALLAAYLRDRGYSTAVLDAEVEELSHEDTARRAGEINPGLVALVVSGTNPSASTMNMTGARELLKRLKEQAPESKRLILGLHPSALPERSLLEEDLDFVCQGEGFYTLPELLDALKAGASAYPVPGLWYLDNGAVVSNRRPAPFENLDELSMPAWDLLPLNKYRAHNWHCFGHIDRRQPYAVIYTSLGCPFKCSFCCINSFFGKPGIRYRSLELVIEEIDWLVSNHGIRNIKLLDEMFTLNKKHVHRFCDLIIERGYDLNIWAYARLNTVDREMLRKMKRAGINWVAYGFESASKKVLDDVTKGYDNKIVDEAVRMTYEEGLHICANYIFGLPEDNRETMQETLDLALRINAEWANIYCAMAYPGSRLYDLAVRNRWPLPESWQGYSQYAFDTLPLCTRHLQGGEVLSFRDRAFQVYYRNPRYLDMIGRKFDRETVEHIRKMSVNKMERKYAS